MRLTVSQDTATSSRATNGYCASVVGSATLSIVGVVAVGTKGQHRERSPSAQTMASGAVDGCTNGTVSVLREARELQVYSRRLANSRQRA